MLIRSGIRTVVPGATLVLADLNIADGFYFSDLVMGVEGGRCHALVLIVTRILASFLKALLIDFDFLLCHFLVCLNYNTLYSANAGVTNPFVHPSIYAFIMNVVLV